MSVTRIINKFFSFCFFLFKLKHFKLAYLFAFYKLPKHWAASLQVSNGILLFTNSGNTICIAQLDQFEFSMHFLIELLANPLCKVTETTNTYFMVEVEGLLFKVASLSNMAVLYEIFIEKIYNIETAHDNLVVIDIGMNVGVASLYFASQPYVKKVYGYEPFPETFAEASMNVAANPVMASKIKLMNEGVSNLRETRSIPLFESGLLSASTIEQKNEYGKKIGQVIEVQLVSIKEVFELVMAENPNAKILLKLDCEGEEYVIFDMLKESTYLNNVVVAIIEWHEKGSTTIEKVLIDNEFTLRHEHHKTENSGMIYAIKNLA
jgi:FkbM family methyltransferase